MTSISDPTLPDAVSIATKEDPRTDYRTLASHGLFFDRRLNCWVATSAAVVNKALSCPTLTVRPQAEPVPAALLGTPAGDIFANLVRMNDGQAHAMLKTAVQTALDSFEEQYIQQIAREIANWFDLPVPLPGPSLSRFNYGLPTLVLAKLFGIHEEYWPQLIDDVLAFVRCVAPGGNPEEITAGIMAADRLTQYIRQQICAPGPLLQRLLLEMEKSDTADGGKQATLTNAIGFWFQACEGTAGLIGQGLLRGLQCAWEGSAAQWIEHVLNDLPPIQNTRRFVSSDMQLAGCPLHAGDSLLALLVNHHQASDRNYAFGHGAHACPGALWARTIAAAGIDHLAQLGVNEQTLAHWQWRRSLNARVPEFY